MLKKIFAAVMLLLIFSLALISCDKPQPTQPAENKDPETVDYDEVTYNVTVKLTVDDNCVVISDNPVKVTPDGDATFKLLFKDNYSVDKVAYKDYSFKDGYLTLKGCKNNQTVSLTSKSIAKVCSFDIETPDETLGTVTHSVKIGEHLENTVVNVEAIPAEGQTFIGWSEGGLALEGGKVVSYSTNYSFAIKNDVKLYPNFLTEGCTIIKYYLNGGTTADGSSDTIITQFSGVNHLAPNLIADNGTIIRPGYTLLEFAENEDGTGEAINPGGMAKVPKQGAILELYAQWAEWSNASNFMYKVDSATNEITITAYTANEGRVVIPEYIEITVKNGNGDDEPYMAPVTKIAAGAFFGKSFETLVVPKTVLTMESGAFNSCKNFDVLYITDTFTSIPNDAFKSCKAFSNMRLNASLDPRYVNHAESIGRRLEVVMTRDEDKPLVVFVGGSSCLYGVKADAIEADLDYSVQVLNAGTNAAGLGILYMEGMAHYMRSGDIFVNVPEYGNPQMGKTAFAWRVFRATETCYNIYRYSDFSKYTNFFQAMSEYNTLAEAKNAGKPTTYDQKVTSLTDRYCNLPDKGHNPNPANSFNAVNIQASHLGESEILNINTMYEGFSANGIKYYFSCAPILYRDDSAKKKSEENAKAFYQKAVTNLKCPVISTPLDYYYHYTDYDNSSYHLSAEAGYKHSKKLANDLRIQLIADNVIK